MTTPGDRPALALAAASAAAAAAVDLIELARDGAHPADMAALETIETLADALKCTLELAERFDGDHGQLLAACAKFLEGWA